MPAEKTLAITMHNTHSTVTCEGSKSQFQTMGVSCHSQPADMSLSTVAANRVSSAATTETQIRV